MADDVMTWRTNFYELQPGASAAALAQLRGSLPAPLPDSFFELLAFSNGGEWPAGAGQFSFRLMSAEEIGENLESEPGEPHEVHEFLRGFILIGSNGGGLPVGFDIRGVLPWPMIEFDRDADPEDRVVEIVRNFDEFLDILGV